MNEHRARLEGATRFAVAAKWLPVWLAAAATLIALTTLFGYATGVVRLVVFRPEWQTMSVSTALLCFALAFALVSDARRSYQYVRISGGAVLAFSTASLIGHALTGHDPFSPTLLKLINGLPVHSETSIATAMCSGMLGVSCVSRPRSQPAAALAIAVMLIAGLAVLGYAYGVQDLYALSPFRTMSLRTALAILTLATGFLLSNRENGVSALVLDQSLTGRTTRRQLGFLILPPVIAFVLLRATSADQLGPAAAMAFLVVLTIAPIAALILRDAKALAVLDIERRAKRRSDRERVAAERRYYTLFTRLETGFCVIEMAFDAKNKPLDYRFIEVNPAFAKQTGLSDAAGRWMRDLVPGHEQHWFDIYACVALTGEPTRFEHEAVALGRHFDVSAFRVDEPGAHHVAILFNDITDRKRTELDIKAMNETLERRVAERAAELEQTQDALRQSQKMEAVGQLTGGLAHDFNNLLTGISGSLDLLQKRLGQGRINDTERYINAAQGASKRAAALTHRLLAFSRRQTLDPKPTDVGRLIRGMADLIRRTVGPEITVETVDMVGLWTALVDPNQLENALLNLAINARDAMPDGGRLTIETGNKWMDDRAAHARDVPPGQYMSICVSDTGMGMSPGVIARAFDPFFTTKPIGQGTGLGLSMIYGFARQSGGQVRIYSEVGQGAMVCIYLPRHYGEEEIADVLEERVEETVSEAGETVLVIDDEATVRMLITDVLSDFGYKTIEAEDGAAGLKVLQSGSRVDLLVTDVGLPGGMNGRQVADAARLLRPDLKVLFITGYAENAVVGNGHLDPGMAVLTKPFAMDDLAGKIRLLIETK